MALTAAKGAGPWQFSFCARKKKTPLSLRERQRRTNLCGTTLVAGKHRPLDCSVTGTPGGAYWGGAPVGSAARR